MRVFRRFAGVANRCKREGFWYGHITPMSYVCVPCLGIGALFKYSSAAFLYSTGMCTIEGKNGTIAATRTTPHTDIAGFPHMRQAIS